MKPHSRTIATITITDLKIPALIGTNDWEQKKKQDILLNIQIQYDATKAADRDSLADALDYKTLKQKIIRFVASSHYGLLEKLTKEVLDLIMADRKILAAVVRIDKPRALRFAKSVSVSMSAARKRS